MVLESNSFSNRDLFQREREMTTQWSSSRLSDSEDEENRLIYNENTSPLTDVSINNNHFHDIKPTPDSQKIENAKINFQSSKQRYMDSVVNKNIFRPHSKEYNSKGEIDPPGHGVRFERVRFEEKRHRIESNKTHLHTMCQNMTTLDDIVRTSAIMNKERDHVMRNASKKDENGSTALHIFASNKDLSTGVCNQNLTDFESGGYYRIQQQLTFETVEPESNFQKQTTFFLTNDLLAAFPPAAIACDHDGYIPFEIGLIDWVESCKAIRRNERQDTHGIGKAFWESSSHVVRSAMNLAPWKTKEQEEPDITSPNRPKRSRGKSRISQIFSPNTLGDVENDSKLINGLDDGDEAASVRLSPHARFSLIMLSAVIDQLDLYKVSKSALRRKQRDSRIELNIENFEHARTELKEFYKKYGSVDIASGVVQKVASIPGLMETILMIKNDEDREFVISTPIIREVMRSKESIGTWFTAMLQSRDRMLSQRAVEYLKRVSNQTYEKDYDPDHLQKETNRHHPAYDPLIDAFSNLQDFVPALLALGNKGMEEASTTRIGRGVLNRMISKPFAVTVVLCDFIFLALMIIGFRLAVTNLITGGSLGLVLRWIYVSNTGIFYFITREIGKFFSLLLISKQDRSYFFSFWNVIDLLATVLALVSTVSMRYHFDSLEEGVEDLSRLRGLLAVTTGFLWLRVLSLLKAINMQLATFVLAIVQIAKDIFWFCVILVTLVVSFSQMFFTLLAPPSCAANESDPTQCRQGEYLLRVYTILLGDFGNFDLERFKSKFSVFLLVLYSFLVTVVLLNVLIAIASDSYEKCLLRSQHLFGRARVMLVAELVSFQDLLKRTDNGSEETSLGSPRLYSLFWTRRSVIRNWSRSSVLFFFVCILVVSVWTIAELSGYLHGGNHGSILFSLGSVFVNLILFNMIMVFLANGASRASRKKDSEDLKRQSEESFVQKIMLRLLFDSERKRNANKINDWRGRVHHLQEEMARIAKEHNALALEQSKTMENMMSISEARIRTEINDLHESIGSLRKAVLGERHNGYEV